MVEQPLQLRYQEHIAMAVPALHYVRRRAWNHDRR